MDRWTHKKETRNFSKDGPMDGWTDGHKKKIDTRNFSKDGPMDRWTDGRIKKRQEIFQKMDQWTDGPMDIRKK
jgi:hypothetical protein